MTPTVTKKVRYFCLLVFLSIVLPLFLSSPGSADDLGEFIIEAITKRNEKPTRAALLLLTRDLKWYEANMGRLPQDVQDAVQRLRISIAGDSSRIAAQTLNEAESVFAATGSWNPGRDMDILYLGKNGDRAAATISSSYETVTGGILAGAENDPILRQYRGEIPGRLTAESLTVCTTELPNYGYADLEKAYK
ncbi:MAG TPA: hypothetical protein VN328_00935, partial [Thermodesulfovibrionales bacterium]|nr:hypothetical protein [Thermodesulfovibrionales bacterium]